MRRPQQETVDAARAHKLKTISARVTLATAIALTAVKFGGWFITGSMALMASAIDSLVDAGASFVTLIGVYYAHKPPDRDHRFGHGKGEAIAAFTQATFLAGAAFVLAAQSIERLIFPIPLEAIEVGLALISGSLVVACALVTMQTYVVRKTASTAIAADRAHYATDIATNSAVIFALGATEITGWQRIDPALALLISGYMLWNAFGIVREALEQLLDRELPNEERRKIKETVRACAGVRDIHDLRTRFSGDRTFVEYHLEVDPGLTVDVGHAIGDATEIAVKTLLPGTVEATAHVEPYGIVDARLDDAVSEKS